jgi:hypothetical protein
MTQSESIEGFIAYLKILEISNFITSDDFSVQFKKFCNILEDSLSTHNLEYTFFSDSIIIYSKKINDEQFFYLIQALSEIFNRLLLELQIVICGGVSCGEFSVHEYHGNKIVSGLSLNNALQIEHEQDWIGIVVSPEVIRKVPVFKTLIKHDLNLGTVEKIRKILTPIAWYAYIKLYDRIPIKTSNAEIKRVSGFIIFPNQQEVTKGNHVLENLRKFGEKLEYLRYSRPNMTFIRKIDCTNRMIYSTEANWLAMASIELY